MLFSPNIQQSAERSVLDRINYIPKIYLNKKCISICVNQKQCQIRFGESAWSICKLTTNL